MKNKPVILCIDDEDIILASLKNELRNYFAGSHEILFAESGEEALEIVSEGLENNSDFAVVITDYQMPIMRGDELLIKLHSMLPKTMKIMLTGQATTEGVANVINKAALYRFIFKPWNTEDLVLTISEAIKSYERDKTIEDQTIKLKQMNEKLFEMNKNLEEMNKNLEEIVEQRTFDLQETQRDLIQTNNTLKFEKEQLRVASITDNLTQLYNRGYIINRLQQEINNAIRYNNQLCILMLDLDSFKAVNDTYGHQVGDEVLKKCAASFEKSIRNTDLAGRYGGEEYLIILPHTDIECALVVAERIREEVEALSFEHKDLKITISGGLAQYENESLDLFLRKSDERLYMAKKAGKNKIVFSKD